MGDSRKQTAYTRHDADVCAELGSRLDESVSSVGNPELFPKTASSDGHVKLGMCDKAVCAEV